MVATGGKHSDGFLFGPGSIIIILRKGLWHVVSSSPKLVNLDGENFEFCSCIDPGEGDKYIEQMNI